MRFLTQLAPIPVALLLVTSVGCATSGKEVQSGEIMRAEGPGAVFFSIEDAALDALAYGRTGVPAGTAVMVAGTIQRVDGGFSYTAPRRSTYGQPGKGVLRLSLTAEDVASFVVYRSQADARANRANERVSKRAKRLVREGDSQQRPIYILTPSLRVVRYDANTTQNIARLDEPRPRAIASNPQRQ